MNYFWNKKTDYYRHQEVVLGASYFPREGLSGLVLGARVFNSLFSHCFRSLHLSSTASVKKSQSKKGIQARTIAIYEVDSYFIDIFYEDCAINLLVQVQGNLRTSSLGMTV